MDLVYLKSLLGAGLPVWILTGGALLCLALDAFFPKKGMKLIYSAGAVVLTAALYASTLQWRAHQSYAQDLFLGDPLTQFFVIVVLFVGLMSLLNSYSYLKVRGSGRGILPGAVVTLILFSLIGMIFLFASDHLIVNFIGLEMMSLAIYVLVGSNRKDVRSNEAAMKYFVMGSVASSLLLYGIALLYGSYGSFQLSELGKISSIPTVIFLPKIAVAMVLVGVLFKIAAAPFHFWAPDVYEGAPTPITGFMATGVKVAAFAFFIRILVTLHPLPSDSIALVLTIGTVLTLLAGNLGAIVQDNVKRMLAYSSIAHAGYLLLGLATGFKDGAFDPQVTQAVLFYLVGYSFMTLGAFAVLCVMVQEKKEATQFSDLAGLGFSRPWLAAAFSLFMISLLGIPGTVGFAAKYGIFSYAVANGYIGLAVFGILTSLVSAYYYLRPLVVMYFRGSAENKFGEVPLPLLASLIFCSAAVIYLGIFPTKYLNMASMAVAVFK